MRLFLGIALFCLLAGNAMSQRGGGGCGVRGGGAIGFRGPAVGFRGGFTRGGVHTGIRNGMGRAGRGWNQTSGSGYIGGGLLDYGGDSGSDLAFPLPDQTPSFPNVIVVPPLNPPEPPPPPAHPVIREYHWPVSDEAASAPFFSIVTNDSSIHYATMVWTDGKLLRFITREGTTGQVLRSTISRDRTYQANSGKNLKPWLP